MDKIKITIIGCSVAVRVRPSELFPDNNNYGVLLEKFLNNKFSNNCIDVNNYGFSRATIFQINEKLEEYITTFPDFFVLNIGVPDASTREIPYWYAQILNNKKNNLLKYIFSFIHSKIITKNNAFFVKLRKKRPWVSEKKFSSYYEKILQTIVKETNARIIVLAINPTSNRVEMSIPGSRNNYIRYNKIIQKFANKYNANFISFENLEIEKYFPDGIHYNLNGHQFVAQKLFEIVNDTIEN